jgi:hypothetical protein
MVRLERELRYCVIGAGASGIAAAKNFRERGIPFDWIEREGDIGGIWNPETKAGRVYKSTHMVSSKEFTWFDDYPMPEDYPLFPSHQLALSYLRDYAREFGILDTVELNTSVESLNRDEAGWQVQIEGEARPRSYSGVVIANGHHEVPRMPPMPGRFFGEILHSSQYRNPTQLAGKRVLIIGAGNSGGDLAVDAVHHAREAILSMRRGYYFIPRFLFGIPVDDVIDFVEFFRPPRWLRQIMYGIGHRLAVGPNWRYGLEMPKHKILDTHPTVSAELPSLVAEGRLSVKPDVAEYDGSSVRFTDGSEAEIDLVVTATGYAPKFPFIDKDEIVDENGRSRLLGRVFHPEWDDLFVVGLINANGSMWRLADYQARLVSGYIVAKQLEPKRAEKLRDKLAASGPGGAPGAYVDSDRHRLEVDYHDYRRYLLKLVKGLGKTATQGRLTVPGDSASPAVELALEGKKAQVA